MVVTNPGFADPAGGSGCAAGVRRPGAHTPEPTPTGGRMSGLLSVADAGDTEPVDQNFVLVGVIGKRSVNHELGAIRVTPLVNK